MLLFQKKLPPFILAYKFRKRQKVPGHSCELIRPIMMGETGAGAVEAGTEDGSGESASRKRLRLIKRFGNATDEPLAR